MSYRKSWIGVLVVMLAACSSEPSESEILESMQAALSQSGQEMLGGFSNAPALPTIAALEKIQCSYVSSSKHYECDINLTLDTPAGALQERGRVKLMEEGPGWVVVE